MCLQDRRNARSDNLQQQGAQGTRAPAGASEPQGLLLHHARRQPGTPAHHQGGHAHRSQPQAQPEDQQEGQDIAGESVHGSSMSLIYIRYTASEKIYMRDSARNWQRYLTATPPRIAASGLRF